MSARTARIANGIAAAILLVMAIALWRDPGLVIRAEYAKQRWRLGGTLHEVVVGDHRWAYVEVPADHPDAPTVVMLHGFTGSKENWYRIARALRGKYRLIMPDLPGWGQSERKADADYGYLAQSERVADFLYEIEKHDRRPVALIGHSMGGGIAALVAAHHAVLVARLGLIDAAGVRFRENGFAREVLAGRNPFEVHDDASLETYLSTVFGVREARPWMPWPATSIYIAQRRSDAAFEQRVLDRIGRGPQRFLPGDKAGYITQPSMLLWCNDDKVIDPSAMTAYAGHLVQANRVLLYGCGHMSIMERPGESADAIRWLIEHASLGELPQ